MQTMKLCSRCKVTKRVALFPKKSKATDGLSSWCRDCYTEDSRSMKTVMRTKAYRLKNKFKKYCQNQVRTALLSGKLIKPKACIKCKTVGKTEAHHEDYDKPLEVVFLCRSCHQYRHSEIKKELS